MIVTVLMRYNDAYVGEPVAGISINSEGHLITRLANGKVRESTRVVSIEDTWVHDDFDGAESHPEVVVTTRTSTYVFEVCRSTCRSSVDLAAQLCDELESDLRNAISNGMTETEEWWA